MFFYNINLHGTLLKHSHIKRIILQNDRFKKKNFKKTIIFKNDSFFVVVFITKRSIFKIMKTLTSLPIAEMKNNDDFVIDQTKLL